MQIPDIQIPPQFYSFMEVYWPHVLIGSIVMGYAPMIYTATVWALKRRSTR